MAKPWSEREVEAIVADYLSMLAAEARGEPFNKAAHNRELQRLLDQRQRASVEFKHRNITAVLHDLGYPGIEGYKPLPNYQGLLLDVVQRMVTADESLRRLVARRVKRGRVNYLEREARNASLGKAGEDLVLDFERRRLVDAGRPALARKVKSASESLGDGAGFDIQSFEVDGQDRLIEVKTTVWGRETPFFVSRNEVAFSTERAESYFLYRVFRMPRAPQLYTVRGALSDSFRLVPELYSGRVA